MLFQMKIHSQLSHHYQLPAKHTYLQNSKDVPRHQLCMLSTILTYSWFVTIILLSSPEIKYYFITYNQGLLLLLYFSSAIEYILIKLRTKNAK
jgi:hypothetical protein